MTLLHGCSLSSRCGRIRAFLLRLKPVAFTTLTPQLPDKKQRHIGWGQLYGASQKLIIASSAIRFNGMTVVLVPDTHHAVEMEDGLRFFTAS